jgi:diguanylate cyclase (GGDEF)-like protein
MLAPVLPIPPVSASPEEDRSTGAEQDIPQQPTERRARTDLSLELRTAAVVAAAFVLLAALALTVLDGAPGWAFVPAAALAAGLVIAVYHFWVFSPIEALVARSRRRLGENYQRSDPRYGDELRELGYLVNTLIAVFNAAEDKEWVSQAVTADLMRVQETKRQLLDIGGIGAEINAALPYRETVERALTRSQSFLQADAALLVRLDDKAGAFKIEGCRGLEQTSVSADCCAYTMGCPVRGSIGTGEIARSADHSCGLLPSTLSAQLALPFTIAGLGDFALLVAATAWDHFGDVPEEVLVALQGHIQSALANSHRYDAIRRQVITDHLTGLYNRRHFQNRAREETERSLRYQQPLSVLMVDIDHFKHFNDRFGHATGDRVLQAVAGVLKRALRNVDLCARLGGEEFAILLPNTPAANAFQVAERVRATLAGTRYTGLGLPPEENVTISIGVAACPKDATVLEALLELADKALYRAKSQGRDRVCQHGATPAPLGR